MTSQNDETSAFTVHWAPVPNEIARERVADGLQLFALWPAPVNADECFESAGFTDFGDADSTWDARAETLLTRLLAELGASGEPRLVGDPTPRALPWYRRLFVRDEPLGLRERIEVALHRDDSPECLVAFGTSGVTLRTAYGHHLFWITWPARESPAFIGVVERIAAPHPVIRTDLKWECLRP